MAPETLPLELEEEILIRVPALSLVRFRIVCKQWNALFNNKRFVNNHLARPSPEFIITTKSKLYYVSVNLDNDPDIPGLETRKNSMVHHCDGLLLCTRDNGATVWNPWLSQTRLIESKTQLYSFVYGLGYDSSGPEKNYKIVGIVYVQQRWRVGIYQFATSEWKYIDACFEEKPMKILGHPYSNVSLNGNLYWIANDDTTREYFIQSFDCSKEMFRRFCILPCQGRYLDNHALAVFKGDRFSLLEQCDRTRRIQIWVTENKVDDSGDVVWIKLMTVSTPSCPMLSKVSSPSYFVDSSIYGKSLVICCIDECLQACIFIAREDLCRKIKLKSVVGQFFHSLCVSSLIPIPWESSDQENKKGLGCLKGGYWEMKFKEFLKF
ncbi:unnamed protein product [Microthlaspi erraticum]|uniref:F-box domain-containing protein n=1 Tax=Microthlaspi erraticum TaxID=1685480 RepID=A0A6D2K5I5_9BRAS|nr:unnamed protein product [Microthlaspi erraticum]